MFDIIEDVNKEQTEYTIEIAENSRLECESDERILINVKIDPLTGETKIGVQLFDRESGELVKLDGLRTRTTLRRIEKNCDPML